jgi:ubiquinone/menaquinone biosynthesis C-methylase UbiE
MSTTELNALEQIKQAARATWAAGDFPEVARRELWEVGATVVDRVAVEAGEEVLDVACGTGNAATRAAQAGARVVGVDLTPELLAAGERLADELGLRIEFVEGDAEAIPFEPDSFDVVVSTFGCMFAPRQAVAAAEIVRVLRPGGRLAITAWTPGGAMGEFFKTIGSYLPPPPPGVQPPLLWGSEAHVRTLFDGSGVELEFERLTVPAAEFATTEEAIEFMTSKFGPLIMARRMLEPAGRWPALLDDLRSFHERGEPGEYLLTLGRKRGVSG